MTVPARLSSVKIFGSIVGLRPDVRGASCERASPGVYRFKSDAFERPSVAQVMVQVADPWSRETVNVMVLMCGEHRDGCPEDKVGCWSTATVCLMPRWQPVVGQREGGAFTVSIWRMPDGDCSISEAVLADVDFHIMVVAQS
jgi:hypothetical protein